MAEADALSRLSPAILRCRHSLPILSTLYLRPTRFSEIGRTLNIRSNVLVRKLSALETHGLVEQTSSGYALTEYGRALMDGFYPLISEVEPQVVAEVLKCKWSKEILRNLLKGPRYSAEIVNSLRGLSWKVASDRLKKLQRLGLVNRLVMAESSPVRVAYVLTRKGKMTAMWMESAMLEQTGGASVEYI
ncbi:MAG: winged helix-turn-helix transcriptional regulator [Candidatus Caldarchaeum sp.]|nr:winged helix-turn-helix transcriptional regulator [Candidatus Caldarchaeum sp.]MDW8359534.1 winged helix-turn-helix transcriptional regulator [Candidatus Caldarchaeum sp.]